MVCNECGIKNAADAANCSSCGTALQKAEPGLRGGVCSSCGSGNPPESKFCSRCGINLKHSHGGMDVKGKSSQPRAKFSKRRNPARRWHPAVVGLGLLGIGILIVVILQGFHDRRTSAREAPVFEAKSQDPKLEAGVIAIASKFICSCGSCGEKPLEICACERAIEERQFIRNALQTGKSADQIIAAVNATFGWMKPDSAGRSLSGIPALANLPAVGASYGLVTAHVADTSQTPATDRIASSVDRNEIFAHFRCACGQCGMDDLGACTCRHPHGATEVKAFVDNIIAGGKLSVAQVIKEVDQEYGGRKF